MNNFIRKYPTLENYPITWFIILLNALFFIVQTVSGGSTNTVNLVRLGAKFDYGIAQGEYWRLLTATFLHIGAMCCVSTGRGSLISQTLRTFHFDRNLI